MALLSSSVPGNTSTSITRNCTDSIFGCLATTWWQIACVGTGPHEVALCVFLQSHSTSVYINMSIRLAQLGSPDTFSYFPYTTQNECVFVLYWYYYYTAFPGSAKSGYVYFCKHFYSVKAIPFWQTRKQIKHNRQPASKSTIRLWNTGRSSS